MLGYRSDSRFYPRATGDPGQDRNGRTVQFSSLLFASVIALMAALDALSGSRETPTLALALLGLVAAMAINRAGKWEWAAWLALSSILFTAVMLVYEARDGFRSNAMLIFPGMLLLSVMLLNRVAYSVTASVILLAVAALGVAERLGLTQAIPGRRSLTTLEGIFFVDLFLLVLAIIGSRLARDIQIDIFDLRTNINRLSEANLELQQTAEAWRNSKQELDSLYHTVADPLFRLAVEGEGRFRFVSVNASFLRVTGLSQEMVIDKTVTEVIPEPALTMVLARYREAIEEKTVKVWEETSNYPTGRLTGIVSVVPTFNEEDVCTHLTGSVHDITDLRRAQTADFARQKLESLGTLAAGIAHDFNNLLGVVLTQSEMALLGLAAGSNPEVELKTIRVAAERAADVVRQLMTYAGNENVAVGVVDVSQIIGEMRALLTASVQNHAALELQLDRDRLFVRASPTQLQQVVMNLVTNASDAVGDGEGIVRITTTCVKADQDCRTAPFGLRKGDYAQLEVSDTGCGMTPEMRARVFDPFFTTKPAGHGLGLSIVHGIVQRLNGAIQVMSEPGSGTTFQILLPLAEKVTENNGRVTAQTPEPVAQPLPAAVLVVEDEDFLRQAVVKMLRRAGIEVFEAADGSTAINLIRARMADIELILLDMTIPGASSAEVMAEAARTCPHTGIILTSAYSKEMLAESVGQPQVRGFIRKPFALSELVRTIRNVLGEMQKPDGGSGPASGSYQGVL
jgi:PAS domain S-box-containing protein